MFIGDEQGNSLAFRVLTVYFGRLCCEIRRAKQDKRRLIDGETPCLTWESVNPKEVVI